MPILNREIAHYSQARLLTNKNSGNKENVKIFLRIKLRLIQQNFTNLLFLWLDENYFYFKDFKFFKWVAKLDEIYFNFNLVFQIFFP